jgi:hypothetical protein
MKTGGTEDSRPRGLAFITRSIIYGVVLFSPLTSWAAEPWRLDDVIPGEVFSLSVNQRIRYEYLDEQFGTGPTGSGRAIELRTLIHGEVRPIEGWTLGAELQDSRAYATHGQVLGTTDVNAVEILRAYVQFRRDDVLGGKLRVSGGRITMNLGSRRLAARNQYRNTINGFTGLDAEWQSDDSGTTSIRAFWTMPVDRRPRTNVQERYRDNEIQFDEENLDLQFWGLFGTHRFASDDELELFYFGLNERDRGERASANRNLSTLGFRLLRDDVAGAFDYQVELALQFGRSRAGTSSSDLDSLDHLAHFEHLELGYTFDVLWSPRVALEFDYASGDRKSTDGKNGQFDTLYGARRFDYGPTGIYGPISRSNLITPGLAGFLKPIESVTSMLAFRAFWLASDRDAWAATGVVDPTGQSGTFIGSQIEFRIRWKPLPGNLHLEAGYAHLFDGEFMKHAPNSIDQGDSNYVYAQSVVTF